MKATTAITRHRSKTAQDDLSRAITRPASGKPTSHYPVAVSRALQPIAAHETPLIKDARGQASQCVLRDFRVVRKIPVSGQNT